MLPGKLDFEYVRDFDNPQGDIGGAQLTIMRDRHHTDDVGFTLLNKRHDEVTE